MTPRARQLVLLLVLGLLIVFKAQQPGPLLALGSDVEPFPPGLVVAPAPAADLYDDHPEVRVLQLLASMNAMWERAFADAGDEYERPRIEARRGEPASACGRSSDDWAGIYCPKGRRIVIDMQDHDVVRAAAGHDEADDALGYVLAHEVGHHVQAQRGMFAIGSQAELVRAELHAQCLAGVWGRAAGRPAPPRWSYAPDEDHGSAEQQRRWLERGHATGRPGACDAIWDAEAP